MKVLTTRCSCQEIGKIVGMNDGNFNNHGKEVCQKICADNQYVFLEPTKFGIYNRFLEAIPETPLIEKCYFKEKKINN